MTSLLNETTIRSHLIAQQWLYPLEIEILPCITSTNDYLKAQLATQIFLPRVCLAEQQTQGRGQLQKNWHSPHGENIYFSYAFSYEKNPATLEGLSLVIGLSVIKTLHDYTDLHDIKIKWPNDIFWQNKKLVGILVETQMRTNDSLQVIIGIGINVNMASIPEDSISQPWTSLKCILNADQDRNKIVGLLIPNISSYLQTFIQSGFSAFVTEWMRYDYLYGKAVSVKHKETTVAATVAGINNQGHLLLRHADGNIVSHSSNIQLLLSH